MLCSLCLGEKDGRIVGGFGQPEKDFVFMFVRRFGYLGGLCGAECAARARCWNA